MSTKRINVTTILPPSALFIGYVAENGVTNVEFDVSAWVAMYGSGTATLIMKRWGDANPYPIALAVDNEGLATWTISATDTAKKGFAYAQLRYEAGTKVKKSPIYTLKIGDSLGSPAEAPDQYEDWIDALTHIAAQAMAEVLDIEGIVTDKTLTVDGGIADAKATGDALSALEDAVGDEISDIKAEVKNVIQQKSKQQALYNLLDSVQLSSKIAGGLVWTPLEYGGVHVEGTSTNITMFNIIDAPFPDWLQTNVDYYVGIDNNDENILFQIYSYDSGGNVNSVYSNSKNGLCRFVDGYDARILIRIRVKEANVELNTELYPRICAMPFLSGIEANMAKCFSGETLVSSSAVLDDFDNALTNRYYSINVKDIPHSPVAEKGHLICFGLNGGSSETLSGRKAQIYIANNGKIYFRFVYFGSGAPWSDWIKINAEKEHFSPSVSMFKTIGVIGDSFASGEIYNSETGTHEDYYDLSWGQVLARKCGIKVVNYSAGGLSTKTWLTDEHGLAKLNSEEANNLYIIALGINDNRTIGISKIGTISDITSDNIDSFYSYYGRIIRAIQSHAPNSYIMLSTVARLNKDWPEQNYDDFSNAIRAIASHYGYPLLDLSTADLYNSTWFLDNQIRYHPTAVGYSAMAYTYKELIENAMKTNSQYFNGYIGL